MGSPKSLLKKGSHTLGHHLANLLVIETGVPPVLVGSGPLDPPWDSQPKLADDPRIQGPLGGISSLVQAFPATSFVVLAVDLYYFDATALKWLLAHAAKNPHKALWPKFPGRPFGEPMAAFYPSKALVSMVDSGLSGEVALHRALRPEYRCEPIIPREHLQAFKNVNRPEDLPYSMRDL